MKTLCSMLGITLLLGACAGGDGDYWSRKGLSQATLDQDGKYCTNYAFSNARKGRAISKQEDFNACMTVRGYALREFTSAQWARMGQMNDRQRAAYQKVLIAEGYAGRSVLFIPADTSIGE